MGWNRSGGERRGGLGHGDGKARRASGSRGFLGKLLLNVRGK